MVLSLPGSSLLYHGLHGITKLVLMVTALVNDQCQNLIPYRIDTLITKNLSQLITSARQTPVMKVVQIHPGGFRGIE